MSGETEVQPSGWTVDTLRYHFNAEIGNLRTLLDERYETQTTALTAAFAAAERAVQTALLAAEKAVNKAEVAADKRFDLLNEFRGQLADVIATFMTQKEADVRFSVLVSRLDKLEGASSGRSQAWAFLVAAVVAVGGVIAAVLAITNK